MIYSERNSRGFTLVELLVVVSIVGVLGSIATASYSEYRDRAYVAGAETLTRNAATDVESYNMREDALRNVTAIRQWLPAGSAATENASASDILPAVRVNEGYYLQAGINSYDCGNLSRSQFYIHTIPWHGKMRVHFFKTCGGNQGYSSNSKPPGQFWDS